MYGYFFDSDLALNCTIEKKKWLENDELKSWLSKLGL